jgi:4-amino-4-deoxy-L-arabinose transferase-like glycosyltransferase
MKQLKHSRALQTLLVTAVALFILLPQLSFYPLLPPDEARYVEIPREMVAQQDYVIPRLNGVIYLEKPPLFYWLQTLPIKLFGIQEGAMRFWNAFFAAFSIGFVFLAGSILHNRKTGLIAAFMLYSSVLFYALAHIMSLDMTMSAFITGTLFSVLIGLQYEPSLRRRCWFYTAFACAALAVLTKGLIGLLLPGAVVFTWLLLTNSWRELLRAYIPTGLLIFLAITLPWHILAQLRVPEFFDFYVIAQHFTRYLTTAEQRFEPFWWFAPILLIGLLPWLPWVAKACYQQCKKIEWQFSQHKNAMFLLIWPVLIFIFFSLSKSKLIPYILPVLPPLFVLAAQNLQCFNRRHLILGLASLALFTVLIPWWVYHTDRSVKPLIDLMRDIPYDEVAIYGRYYQDVPVYLGETVTLVGSLNELKFGVGLEDVSAQYPDYATFWSRWRDPEHRMIVFLSRNKYDDFVQRGEVPAFPIGETSRVIVVSNFSE